MKSYIDLDLFRKAFAIRIWEIAVHVSTLILVKSMMVKGKVSIPRVPAPYC